MGQLYINGRLLDFSLKTVIGISQQISDIGSIDKVKGNTTNQFKLPITKNNLEILGLPGDLNFSLGYEYKKLAAKYVENGIEVIPLGFATIEGVNDFIELKVLSGNVEFFDLLEGDISELDYSAYNLNHVWNRSVILASLSNADGYIYPVIDYGNLPVNERLINCKLLRPAIFVHTIIDAIFFKTGFKKEGIIFQDPDYLNEILPLAEDKLLQPDGFENAFAFRGIKTVNQKNNDAGSFFKVSFPDTDNSAGAGGTWDEVNNRYIFTQGATVKFKGKFRVSGNNETMQDFVIGFTKNGLTGVNNFPLFFSSASAQVKYRTIAEVEIESDELFFAAGDYVEVWARRYKPAVSFAKEQEVREGSNITLVLGSASYLSLIAPQKSLPKISVKDFVKSFMYRFSLIVQTNNVTKTVTFKPFSDLNKNIHQARDWSDKLDNADQDDRTFSIGSYGQNNYFRYKKDDTVPEGLGDGNIQIADETLLLNKEIINMPFAASASVYRLSGANVALIQKLDPTFTDILGNIKEEFKLKTEPRILRIYRRSFDITEPLKFHEGNTLDVIDLAIDIPLTYFNQPGFNGLGFDDTLIRLYQELIHTLQSAKKVQASFRLNENDIAEHDFFMPVYVKKFGLNFYVNKIDNYIDGQKTKLELIRL